MGTRNISPAWTFWGLPWPYGLIWFLLIALAVGMIIVWLSGVLNERRNRELERSIERELAAHPRPVRKTAPPPRRTPPPAAQRHVPQPSVKPSEKPAGKPVTKPAVKPASEPAGKPAQQRPNQSGNTGETTGPAAADFADATEDSSFSITVPQAITGAGAKVQIDVFELRSPDGDAVRRRILVHRTVQCEQETAPATPHVLSGVLADHIMKPLGESAGDTWWVTPEFPDPASYVAGIGKLQTGMHHLVAGEPAKEAAEFVGLSEPSAEFLGQLAAKIPLPGDQSLTEIRRAVQVTGIIVGAVTGLPTLTHACVQSLAHDLLAKELADSIHQELNKCFTLDADPTRVVSENLEMKPAEIDKFHEDLCAADSPIEAEKVLHELLDKHPAETPEGEELNSLSAKDIWKIREKLLDQEPVAKHEEPIQELDHPWFEL